MKAEFEHRVSQRGVSCEVTLNGVSTKADGSLSLRIQTSREFNAEDTTALMQLNRMVLNMTLLPLKFEEAPLDIGGSADNKSPSQRLRAVLFVWFKEEQKAGRLSKDEQFDFWYAKKIEKVIEWVKHKLPEGEE